MVILLFRVCELNIALRQRDERVHSAAHARSGGRRRTPKHFFSQSAPSSIFRFCLVCLTARPDETRERATSTLDLDTSPRAAAYRCPGPWRRHHAARRAAPARACREKVRSSSRPLRLANPLGVRSGLRRFQRPRPPAAVPTASQNENLLAWKGGRCLYLRKGQLTRYQATTTQSCTK